MSDYPSFLGSSYQSQSPWADSQVLINWYLEHVEGSGARSPLAAYPTPGQQTFVTTTDIAARAALSMGGRSHWTMGGAVYEVFAGMTATKRGTLAQDSNPAQMTLGTGTAAVIIAIASGGNLYYLNTSTNTVSQVAGVAALQVGMIDGFFVAFDPITGRIRVSPFQDATGVWDPLQFAGRNDQPDPWVAMAVAPPDIFMIGEQTGNVFYDAGTAPFPLAPRPGITFRYGTVAPFSVAVVGNSVMWLARDKDGAGVVVQTRGYSPQPVSTKALETALSNYQRTATITDAEAMVYEQEGHQFYVLKFPRANATWCYDLSTQLWHQRMTGTNAWAPRVHTYAFGQHLVGDPATGSINTLDVTLGSEADGSAIRRKIVPAPLWAASNGQRVSVGRFDLVLEPGLGAVTGQGVVPHVMLRTSRDLKTWSNERSASAGALGQYGTRVFWLRNGSSPTLWVPEITVSDPVPWRLVGAEVDATGVQQRAA